MIVSNKGFLLLELVIGLCIFGIFISLIINYTIQLKNIQTEALNRIEALSIARNILEKTKVGKRKTTLNDKQRKQYTVSVVEKFEVINNISVPSIEVNVSWSTFDNQKNHITLHSFSIEERSTDAKIL